MGRTADAASAYRRALEQDSASVRAHVGMQLLGQRAGRELELRRVYREGADPFLAARLEPAGKRQLQGYATASEPWRSLGLGSAAAGEGEWSLAGSYFRRLVAHDAGHTWGRLSQAEVLLARRRFGEAEAQYRAVAWTEPEHPAPAVGLSLLEDRRGHLDVAFRWALEAYERAPAITSLAKRVYSLAARSGNRRMMARAANRLDALGSAGDGEALLWAGSLFRRTGEPDRAEASLKRARAKGVTAEEIAALDRRHLTPEFARFVRKFSMAVRARYRHYVATKEAQSFERFLAWARGLYERETGRKLGPPGKARSFAFIGRVMNPAADSDEPLVRACAREGLLLVIGQRRGGPPEAMLAELERREAYGDVTIRGATVEREVVWLGHRYLSGFLEWNGGGDIAGLALDRIILIDVHAAARWEGGIRRRLAPMRRYQERLLAVPALEDTPVQALNDPAGVAERLFLGGPLDFADEVRVHEDAHLVDAALHLPVGKHPLRNLGLAFKRGFSPRDIMAYLERNAQLTAIAEGSTPRAGLAICCASLGGAGEHARGYTEIVRGFVTEIHKNPARYPKIDPERVILQQLHLLTDDEIRTIARKLLVAWGLVA